MTKPKPKPGRGGPRENSGGARPGAGRKALRGTPTVSLMAQVLPATKSRLQAEASTAGKSVSAYVGEQLDKDHAV